MKKYKVRVVAEYELEVEAENQIEAIGIAIVGAARSDDLTPQWSVEDMHEIGTNENEINTQDIIPQA
jgi:hypothetical protein